MTSTNIMATGTVRLKGSDLIERFNKENKSLYRIALDGDLPYSSLHRLVSSDDVGGVNGETLYGLLVGLGMSLDQAKSITLGDLFEFVEYEQITA